jgi:hypothetical protein
MPKVPWGKLLILPRDDPMFFEEVSQLSLGNVERSPQTRPNFPQGRLSTLPKECQKFHGEGFNFP